MHIRISCAEILRNKERKKNVKLKERERDRENRLLRMRVSIACDGLFVQSSRKEQLLAETGAF